MINSTPMKALTKELQLHESTPPLKGWFEPVEVWQQPNKVKTSFWITTSWICSLKKSSPRCINMIEGA